MYVPEPGLRRDRGQPERYPKSVGSHEKVNLG
jgi:hypothetical protein